MSAASPTVTWDVTPIGLIQRDRGETARLQLKVRTVSIPTQRWQAGVNKKYGGYYRTVFRLCQGKIQGCVNYFRFSAMCADFAACGLARNDRHSRALSRKRQNPHTLRRTKIG